MLKQINIRVAKNQSSFVYFILESNEGTCYYSTEKSSLGTPYRDLKIQFHSSTEVLTQNILKHLESSGLEIEYLS